MLRRLFGRGERATVENIAERMTLVYENNLPGQLFLENPNQMKFVDFGEQGWKIYFHNGGIFDHNRNNTLRIAELPCDALYVYDGGYYHFTGNPINVDFSEHSSQL